MKAEIAGDHVIVTLDGIREKPHVIFLWELRCAACGVTYATPQKPRHGLRRYCSDECREKLGRITICVTD